MSDRDEHTIPAHSEEEARVEAHLALSTRAPASLDERIRARRAAGERVDLPVPGAPVAAPSDEGGMRSFPWRRVALPAAIAAAALLAFLAIRSQRATEPAPPELARRDSVPGAVTPAPTPGDRGARTRDTVLDPGGARSPDLLHGLGGGRAIYGARLLDYSEDVLDSAAAAAHRVPSSRILITHPANDTSLAPIAIRFQHELGRRGIAPARITRSAVIDSAVVPMVRITVSRP